MVVVQVCVGSSCHIRGSYQVIKTFTNLVETNDLGDVVNLKAAFCMGNCVNGINCRVNDTPIENVGFANAEEIFYKHIYPIAQEEKQRA